MYKSIVEGKGGIVAKVVSDSVANSVRLTTLELTYPRFIHSEFMTHRMFSRNASSSRAIPVKKMIEQVENNPAIPIHWGKNQPGMQAREENDRDVQGNSPVGAWSEAAWCMADWADDFSEAGYHKQIVNRLLEPFQFISVVVTATEWDNFFKLRLHEDAQPEIYELARVMKEAIDNSYLGCRIDRDVKTGEYHLPYIRPHEWIDNKQDVLVKCSVARCARVSYLNHDNTEPDIEKDIKLHDTLLEAGHMSPFEHCATPMTNTPGSMAYYEKGVTHKDIKGNYWSGNFRAWKQYRQLV